jgi:putative endonuclease
MVKRSTKAAGDEGEEIAKQYLLKRGLTIIETKYHYGRNGEIDIIAKDGNVLVFCEVKMRTTDEFGDPEFAITPKKQAQIRKLAHAYLYERDLEDQECRFDVVAIKKYGRAPEINYIPNAF